MKFFKPLFLVILFSSISLISKAQYVQKERNDTTYIFPKTMFDSVQVISALGRGSSIIKGVAFTRPKDGLSFIPTVSKSSRIYANKITILIFPVTPYLLEYLDLKKHTEKPKKLRFVYMSSQAYYYHYEAITNSKGEFTIPNLKPGKYYLEGILPWTGTNTYNQYTGSGYDGYGRTDYYTRQSYNVNHYDKLEQFVEIKSDGEVVEIKLK